MIIYPAKQYEGGFIALITAIVLSLGLLTVAVVLNQSGFLTRSALLESEYKERSAALAEACVDIALLRLAANPAYGGGEAVLVKGSECQIRPVQIDVPASGQMSVETRARVHEAVTNLRIVANASDLSILSWNELPSF